MLLRRHSDNFVHALQSSAGQPDGFLDKRLCRTWQSHNDVEWTYIARHCGMGKCL